MTLVLCDMIMVCDDVTLHGDVCNELCSLMLRDMVWCDTSWCDMTVL